MTKTKPYFCRECDACAGSEATVSLATVCVTVVVATAPVVAGFFSAGAGAGPFAFGGGTMCVDERGGCDGLAGTGAVPVGIDDATVGADTFISFEADDEGFAVPFTTSDILFSNTSPVVVLFCNVTCPMTVRIPRNSIHPSNISERKSES